MRSGQTECDINYDPDAWSGRDSNIYPRHLTVTVSLCHLPAITSIEEILTTRYISDHEKVGGTGEAETKSRNTFDYEQNKPIVLFTSFLSAK